MWIVYFKTKLSTYCLTRVGACVISGAHLTYPVSKRNVGAPGWKGSTCPLSGVDAGSHSDLGGVQ